jgi:hypothetical protein
MATFVKFQPFIEDVFEGVHIFGTHQLVAFMTTNANAPTNTFRTLSQVTPIAYTNYSSRNITTSSSAQTAGTYKLILTDLVLTLSGGAGATFRWYGVYNDTPTSPADPLVCAYDHGSDITPANGETVTFDFDGTNGLFSAS